MSEKTKLEEFDELLATFTVNREKAVVKGNKAAARRARANLVALARLAKGVRKELLDVIKTPVA